MSNLIYLYTKYANIIAFQQWNIHCDSNTRSIDLAAKKRCLIFSCQNEIKKKFYTPMSKYISI